LAKAKINKDGQPPYPGGFSVKNSWTAPAKIDRAERRNQALDMRAAGKPFRVIADHFGVSLSTVHDWVVRALTDLPKQNAEAVLKMELRRLETLQASYWDKAVGGDLPAANFVLGVMQKRAQYLGLFPDKPVTVSSIMADPTTGAAVKHEVRFVVPGRLE
jgi:hypothetical protein